MSKIAYIERNFRSTTIARIQQANQIIAQFKRAGYTLTLRQLYYQFVGAGLIKNEEKSYKNLGSIINDGRLAGLIDWDAIEDRTRSLRGNAHWEQPKDVLESAYWSYKIDMWKNQPYRLEVWVEKEALVGIVQAVCQPLDVPFLACKGYASQSEEWRAAMRVRDARADRQEPVILYLGDHDPSGINMVHDHENRMEIFRKEVKIERLALNMDQIRRYNPPPNPAKQDDSRFKQYEKQFGSVSWELDALRPDVIEEIIRSRIHYYRDRRAWAESEALYNKQKAQLRGLIDQLG